MVEYTIDKANAEQDAWTFPSTLIDPVSYASEWASRVTAKYFGQPVLEELLALINSRVSSRTYSKLWTCLAGLNVGDPVYISATDTVTLALATTEAASKVIGFVRYKPSTITCYIEHFVFKTDLSGLTAGSAVYLTDAGAFGATAGTVTKRVGTALDTDEAIVYAAGASGISDLIEDASPTLGGALDANAKNITNVAKLLIGATAFDSALSLSEISSNTYAISRILAANDTAGYGAYLYLQRARGTQSARTAPQDGDDLGAVYGAGHTGSAWGVSGLFSVQADGDHGAGSTPGKAGIWTTATGSTSATQRVHVDASGRVGIAKLSGLTEMLDIVGNIAVTGTVDGVDVSAIGAASHSQNADTGTTGNTFTVDSDSVTGKILIDVALGAADKSLTLTNAVLTDNRVITFPDSTGTVALTGAAPTAHAASHVTGGGDTIADAIAAGNSGLMSGADKTKLDGIEAMADVTDAANVLAALAEPAANVVFNEAGADYDFRIEGVGAANAFFVQGSDGKVGIGTATPAYPLTQKSAAAEESATLGAELLAAGDTWVLGANWAGSFGAGFAHTPGSTATLEDTTVVPTAGNRYQITYTVTGRMAGAFTITFGSVTSIGITATGAWGPTATGAGTLVITPTSLFDGTIVISIKQITAQYNPSYAIINAAGDSTFQIRSSAVNTNCLAGRFAGAYLTTGFQSAAFGAQALYSATTGYQNTAFGVNALYSTTTGHQNLAFGTGSLYSNVAGYENVGLGAYCLYANTSGYGNACIGSSSLYTNTSGYLNVANGYNAGRYITDGATANATGNNSLFLGYNTRAAADGETNQIVIGASSIGLGSNTVVLGNSSIVTTALRGNVGIGETEPGTLFDMAGTAPYLTIHNTTHEDGAGGREGKLIFEGEQSGGELTTLGEIEFSHDGTSDDEKGKLVIRLNDGNDGTSPTERLVMYSGGTTTLKGDFWPATNNAYYLGKNDDDSPFAWKAIILADTTNGKYYRVEVISGVVTATDLTD